MKKERMGEGRNGEGRREKEKSKWMLPTSDSGLPKKKN